MSVPHSSSRPSRLCLVLSGLVFPGVGQIAQRRWVAGIMFLLLTLTAFIIFCVHAVGLIVSYYRLMYASSVPEPQYGPMLSWFAITLGVYLASLLDTYRAYRRACTRQAETEFLSRMDAG